MASSNHNDEPYREPERAAGTAADAGALDTVDDEPEVPRDTVGTVRRLWAESAGQHWRFAIVVVCIVLYMSSIPCGPRYRRRLPMGATLW